MDRKIKLRKKLNANSPTIDEKHNIIKSENERLLLAKANKDRTSVRRHVLADLATNVLINSSAARNEKAYSKVDKSLSHMKKTRRRMFEDEKYPNLYGKYGRAKYKTGKMTPIEEKQEFPEENKILVGFPDVNFVAKAISEWNALAKHAVSDKSPTTDGAMKMKSPRALNIRRSDASSLREEHVSRREISHKMQNLIDKLGDLKIYSPMDPPPLLKKKAKTEETGVDSSDDECIADHVDLSSVSRDSAWKKPSNSTISAASNAEAAITFDNLPSVEKLSNVMHKTRTRIPAKRRAKSREVRRCMRLCCFDTHSD